MMTVKELRNNLEAKKGSLLILNNNLKQMQVELVQTTRKVRQHEEAREIIREVGIKTQQQLQFHISNITSLALEAVFRNPYALEAEFVQRRNKTECDLYFVRDEERVDPLSASGGGAVDVASFALRIASWSMQRPKSQPVMLLDEPMRFLSVDLQERASSMIKEISQKLGIQFIIITHESTLATEADKVFEISLRRGITKIS